MYLLADGQNSTKLETKLRQPMLNASYTINNKTGCYLHLRGQFIGQRSWQRQWSRNKHFSKRLSAVYRYNSILLSCFTYFTCTWTDTCKLWWFQTSKVFNLNNKINISWYLYSHVHWFVGNQSKQLSCPDLTTSGRPRNVPYFTLFIGKSKIKWWFLLILYRCLYLRLLVAYQPFLAVL